MIKVELLGPLASMNLPWGDRHFQPAVWKKKDSDGYGVRILKSSSWNRDGSRRTEWDYFDLDAAGKVVTCPRGMTKQFKGLVVADIDKVVEEYATKRINQD